MKFLSRLSLLILLLATFPATAQSLPDSGFSCRADNQCVKIDNMCGGMAVNKKYLEQYRPVAENLDCEEPVPVSPLDVPRCVNGWCMVVRLSAADFHQELYKCETSEECTVMYDDCEDIAINRKYMDQIRPSGSCIRPTPHDPHATGRCVNKRCVP